MTFRILSCDGGGIRGLITAMLIKDLDTSSGLLGNVHGFAGTSTGGLLALMLVHGVNIDDIITMYTQGGETIFTPNGWLLDDLEAQHDAELEKVLGTGPGLLRCKYTATGLTQVAMEKLQTATLADATRLVVVNSARLWDTSNDTTPGNWEPATFSNAAGNAYRDLSMVDAALATSAAPTYFPPHQIAGYGYFADGGVFANNPAITAIGEALSSGQADGLADIQLLSLGTGSSPQGISPADIGNPLNWGAAKWLDPMQRGNVPGMPVLNLTMDATAEVAAVQGAQLLGDNFRRANITLSKPYALDDWQDIASLQQQTQAYIDNDPQWQAVRAWVATWAG